MVNRGINIDAVHNTQYHNQIHFPIPTSLIRLLLNKHTNSSVCSCGIWSIYFFKHWSLIRLPKLFSNSNNYFPAKEMLQKWPVLIPSKLTVHWYVFWLNTPATVLPLELLLYHAIIHLLRLKGDSQLAGQMSGLGQTLNKGNQIWIHPSGSLLKVSWFSQIMFPCLYICYSRLLWDTSPNGAASNQTAFMTL